MSDRASDQVTAITNALLLFGLCLLLRVPSTISLIAAVGLYLALISLFSAYRRHLSSLQGDAPRLPRIDGPLETPEDEGFSTHLPRIA